MPPSNRPRIAPAAPDGLPTSAARQAAPTRIQSVSRAAQTLRLLALGAERMTARALAAELEVSEATAHHLLNTLRDEGLVSKDGRRGYELGPLAALLGDAYHSMVRPPRALAHHLRELGRQTGESAYLVGWRRGEVMILDTVEGRHAVRVGELERGLSLHAHARASGKVLLAFAPDDLRTRYLDANPLVALTEHTITSKDVLEADLARVRAEGYATDEEEFKDGVACAAAPIWIGGVAQQGYSVSAPVDRFREERGALVAAVTEAANAASALAPPDDS